jgi:hypothetical protein
MGFEEVGKRTRQELEVALENARTARQVVFELFQDLDGFRLDDYKQFDDNGKGMERLLRYVQAGVQQAGGTVHPAGPALYDITFNGEVEQRVSTDRDKAKEDEKLSLLGLEHPIVRRLTDEHRQLGADERGLVGHFEAGGEARGAMSIWRVEIHSGQGQVQHRILIIGLNPEGERSRLLERLAGRLRDLQPCDRAVFSPPRRVEFVRSAVPEMIRRELEHAGVLAEDTSFSARLLAWVEVG